MGWNAQRLIDRTWEFNNLIIVANVPESNSGIITDSNHIAFGQMEVHTQNGVCVWSEKSLIPLIWFVKNTKTAI